MFCAYTFWYASEEPAATEKSATDGDRSVTTLVRHKRAYTRMPYKVANICTPPSYFLLYLCLLSSLFLYNISLTITMYMFD